MTTHKLDDLQLIMLSAASQDRKGSLVPLPPAAASDLARAGKCITALIRKGLAEEVSVTDLRLAWRDTEQDPTGVVITVAGREAIGVGAQDADAGAPPVEGEAAEKANIPSKTADAEATPSPRPPRTGTKTDIVLELLCRADGATLAELVEATGWLPHTTRAVLTGLRKKGHAITRGKRDDVSCYAIEVAA